MEEKKRDTRHETREDLVRYVGVAVETVRNPPFIYYCHLQTHTHSHTHASSTAEKKEGIREELGQSTVLNCT